MPSQFVSGWDPNIANRGTTRFMTSGRVLWGGPVFADDTRPLPAAFSLSNLVKWPYDQGQVGSCFANAASMVHQIIQQSMVATGYTGTPFNPSRRLIWYQGRKLDGSLGSGQDGGSVINAMAALGPAANGGVGECSEAIWPYKDNARYLEQPPPQSVFIDASQFHVLQIANPGPLDFDTWARAIYNAKPVEIGIWWPYGWDRGVLDQYSRTTGIGRGEFGHAIVVIGWIKDWDGHLYWEIINSHGKIYAPPPAEIMQSISGYNYTGFSFWARDDYLRQVFGMGRTEHYMGAGVEGFTKTELDYMLI